MSGKFWMCQDLCLDFTVTATSDVDTLHVANSMLTIWQCGLRICTNAANISSHGLKITPSIW